MKKLNLSRQNSHPSERCDSFNSKSSKSFISTKRVQSNNA